MMQLATSKRNLFLMFKGDGPAGRMPGLDVIRSLAILLVIFHHYREIPGCPDWFNRFSLRGYIGVDLFFVLSGWLIGGQVIRNYRRNGEINFLSFWIKRWFRTIPPYFFVMIFMIYVGAISFSKWPIFITFSQNYFSPKEWLISWSLCVEEHFYLFLPLVIFVAIYLLRNRYLLMILCVLLIFISPLLRYIVFDNVKISTFSNFLYNYYGVTHFRMDGLAIGVCLAVLCEYREKLWLVMEKYSAALMAFGACLVVVSGWAPPLVGSSGSRLEIMNFFPWVFGYFGVAIGVGMTIPYARQWKSESVLTKVMTFISEHAYALYLVHQLCQIYVVNKIIPIYKISFVSAFFLCLLLSMLTSATLKILIENPSLYFRNVLLQKRFVLRKKGFAGALPEMD